MRTRIAYYPGSCDTNSSSTIYFSDGTTRSRTPPINYALKTPELLEYFEASGDLSGHNTRADWNNFEHYVRRCFPNQLRGSVTLASGDFSASGWDLLKVTPCMVTSYSAFGSSSNPTGGLPMLYNPSPGSGFVPSPGDLTNLVRRSIRAMSPGIRPDLSLLNSVLELKDFKTIGRTLRRIESVDIRRFLQATTASVRKKSLRQILGAGADSYLQGNFNFGPLLQDIAGIRNALSSVGKQVKKLLALEGQRHVAHFNADLGTPYQSVSETLSNCSQKTLIIGENCSQSGWTAQIYGKCHHYRTSGYSSTQFHAMMEYSYYLSSYDREHAQVLGLRDALGVNLNPAIIWNAIPWSFVVDWVFGVSQWLDQFKVSNLEPRTVIHRYLWSTKITRTTNVDTKFNVDMPLLPSPTVRNVGCIEEAYKRQIYNVTTQDLVTSGLSLKEISLIGALGLSRL